MSQTDKNDCYQLLKSSAESLSDDAYHSDDFSIALGPIWLDYSHHQLTSKTFNLLIEYANSCDISAKINALFDGERVNKTEKRAALHTELRKPIDTIQQPEIIETNIKLKQFVEKMLSENQFTDVISIGIGGSYLGSKMTTEALEDYSISPIKLHFLATIDPCFIKNLTKNLDPKKTLVIIASKSFSTLETMANADHIIKWLKADLDDAYTDHVVAITAKPQAAQEIGVPDAQTFPMWDFVGGRFSIWSAIGLPLMLKIGWDNFEVFLSGAHFVDEHFQTSPINENMPIILALLDFWNSEFLGASAHAIIPYSYQLRSLISYLQQLSMESLGKNATDTVQTGNIIFGAEGCQGQHAYHQLLHQGTQNIPVDFIFFANAFNEKLQSQHALLIASALSQAQALSDGNNETGYKAIAGKKPFNIICIDKLTPKTLGMLLALYEHKTYAQSVLMGINAFDQFGVELGKKLLKDIQLQLKCDSPIQSTSISSTINHLTKLMDNK